MSVAKMSKILVLCHKSEANEMLEKIQDSGIAQMLGSDQASLVKAYGELAANPTRPKELEDLTIKTSNAVEFLAEYWQGPKLASIFKPLCVVEKEYYEKVISSDKPKQLVSRANKLDDDIDDLIHKLHECSERIAYLHPWENIKEPVESFYKLDRFFAFPAHVPRRSVKDAYEICEELECTYQEISSTKTLVSCVFAGPADKREQLHRRLRPLDYTQVFFEGMKGTIESLINQVLRKQATYELELRKLQENARELAKSLLDVQIYYDYLNNQLKKIQVNENLPASESVYFLEGWVKTRDFPKIEAIVNSFNGCAVSIVEPAEGEMPPIDIENKNLLKPFEVITRLYGMPHYHELDPTVLLAPFFALFFALCLTDAGYGLVMLGFFIWLIRKLQLNKSFVILLLLCSVLTVFAGAMTGGWFGSAIRDLAVKYHITWLSASIDKMTWFDPLSEPMTFMILSVALGVLQIMFGLCCGFFNVLKTEGLWAAICDKLTWIVLVGSTITIGLTAAGIVPAAAMAPLKILVAVSAAWILLFSHREGGIIARLSMGGYNLFSAVFYIGDILSYLRLMALGMATGGIALAVNIIADIVGGVPYIGPLIAVVVLVFGHLFNIAQSALGAFVHSMRLQFVEYFPKFFIGGGEEFQPLKKEYKYIYLSETKV